MKLIPLTQGKFAKVDDSDYHFLIKYHWQYHDGYAKRGINTVRMSRQILGAFSWQEVDHINGDKLDNRRSNLRLVTRKENVRNVSKRKDTTNIYKGVHYIKTRNKWIARIQINGKRIHSGYFDTEIQAAREYDNLSRKYHGSHGRLNFPS